MQNFNFMLLWAINMKGFWANFFHKWYTKIGTFIPYRLGHIENIFWTLVNGLFIFWTCSSSTMLPTTRFVLSSSRLALGRAPALQLRPIALCQALAADAATPGPDLTHTLASHKHKTWSNADHSDEQSTTHPHPCRTLTFLV